MANPGALPFERNWRPFRVSVIEITRHGITARVHERYCWKRGLESPGADGR